MSDRLPFVTDPNIRGYIVQRTGLDPDSPQGRVAALQLGLNPGVQPATGLLGDVAAFGLGVYGSLANTARGLADLPLAASRELFGTEAAIGPRELSFVERANPAAAGLGQLVGTIGQFAVPEALIGRLGAIQKLRALGAAERAGVFPALGRLGRVEAGAAGRLENFAKSPGVLGFGLTRGARTAEDLSQFATNLAPRYGLRTPDMAAVEFLRRAAAGARPGPLAELGLTPAQIASRAVPSGLSFAAFEAVQPGDIGDRLERGMHGLVTGLTLGALSSPAGRPLLESVLRDAAAASVAFQGQPILDVPIPGLVQTALFGGLAGLMRPKDVPKFDPKAFLESYKGRKIKLPKRVVFDAREQRPVVQFPSGVRPQSTISPTQQESRKVYVLPRWMDGVQGALESSSELMTKAREGTLTPEIHQAMLDAGIPRRVVDFRRNAQSLPELAPREHERIESPPRPDLIIVPGEENIRPTSPNELIFTEPEVQDALRRRSQIEQPPVELVLPDGAERVGPRPEGQLPTPPPEPPQTLPRTQRGNIPTTVDVGPLRGIPGEAESVQGVPLRQTFRPEDPLRPGDLVGRPGLPTTLPVKEPRPRRSRATDPTVRRARKRQLAEDKKRIERERARERERIEREIEEFEREVEQRHEEAARIGAKRREVRRELEKVPGIEVPPDFDVPPERIRRAADGDPQAVAKQIEREVARETITESIKTGRTPRSKAPKGVKEKLPPPTVEERVEQIATRSRAHAEFHRDLNEAVEAGLLDKGDVLAIMLSVEYIHPSVLERVKISRLKPSDVKRIRGAAELAGSADNPEFRILLSNLTDIGGKKVPRAFVFFHEFGHMAWRAFLTADERRTIKREARRRGWTKEESLVYDKNSTFEEWFSDMFAKYVLGRGLVGQKGSAIAGIKRYLRRVALKLWQKLDRVIRGRRYDIRPEFTTPEGVADLVYRRLAEGELKDVIGVGERAFMKEDIPGFGEPGIRRKHPGVWERMSLEEAFEHTRLRVRDMRDMLTRQGKPKRKAVFAKLGELRRYALKLPTNERSPIMRRLVQTMGTGKTFNPKLVLRNTFQAFRDLGFHYNAKDKILRDELSGATVAGIENTYEALLYADSLWRVRARHPNLDMPGTPAIPIESGPRVQRSEPSINQIGDASLGEAEGLVPPTPEIISARSQAKQISFGKITSVWSKYFQQTLSLMGKIAREMERLGGKEDASRFYRLFWNARESVDLARNMTLQAINGTKAKWWRGTGLRTLAKKHGIPWDETSGDILHRFAFWIDGKMEGIRQDIIAKSRARKGTPEYDTARKAALKAQEAALDSVIAEARARFPEVTDAYEAFYRDVMTNYSAPLYEFLGLDPLEYRFGFYHRLARVKDAMANPRFEGPVESIDYTLESFRGALERVRREPLKEDLSDAGKALFQAAADKDAHLIEQLLNSGNFFETWISYTSNAIRRKVAGDAITELQSSIKTTSEGMMILGAVEGDYNLPAFLADRLRRDIVSMMGLPTRQDISRRNALSLQRVKTVERLMKVAEALERKPVPKPIVEGLRTYYRRLGVKASRGQVLGLADAFIRLHRGQTFGLNLMVSVRDVASTNLLLQARLPTRYFAKTMLDIFFNPKKALEEFVARIERGEMSSLRETLAAPEMEHVFLSTPGMAAFGKWIRGEGPRPDFSLISISDQIQILYKMTEAWTRLSARYASDIAVEGELKRFLKSGRTERDFERFILNTGMAYGEKAMLPEVKARLREAIDTGNVGHLKRLVADWNESQTALLFRRYNSSPLMETTPGKLFLHYGSWPVKVLSVMNAMMTGPARTLTHSDLVAEAYTSLAARYAVGSFALYNLGAMFNVNTTDWIPFVHNTVPSGGPVVTLGQDIREIFSGDPQMMRRLQKQPGYVAVSLLRQAVPMSFLPNSIRRWLSQNEALEGLDEPTRRMLGLAPRQRTPYTRWIVSLGFSPFQEGVYPSYRIGGAPALTMEQTLGALLDWVSKQTGGAVAPGTREEARRFKPLIGGQ